MVVDGMAQCRDIPFVVLHAASAAHKLMRSDNLCYARHGPLIIRQGAKICEKRQYQKNYSSEQRMQQL